MSQFAINLIFVGCPLPCILGLPFGQEQAPPRNFMSQVAVFTLW